MISSVQGRALLVALAFALLGVGALAMYMKQLKIEASGGDKVSVLVMAKAAKSNAPLTEDLLAVRDVPSAYVDDRFVRASDKPKVLGLRLDHATEAQQTLEWQDLALLGQRDRRLGELVPIGARALTLHVPAEYMSVELLRPGDYVDIGCVIQENRVTESLVLLQRVLVLAIGGETLPTHASDKSTGRGESQLLTIAVTLQEAQSVALAARKGPVFAILRSPEDPSISQKVMSVKRVTPAEPIAPVFVPSEPKRPTALKSHNDF